MRVDATLILVLDLAGTFVFGLSGGLAAVRARLDLFGVVVLATAAVPTVAQSAGSTSAAYPVAGAALCVAVRVLGLRYEVNVPLARPHERNGGASPA